MEIGDFRTDKPNWLTFWTFILLSSHKIKKKGKLPSSLKLVMYETVYAQIKKSLAYICVFSYNVRGFNLVWMDVYE